MEVFSLVIASPKETTPAIQPEGTVRETEDGVKVVRTARETPLTEEGILHMHLLKNINAS